MDSDWLTMTGYGYLGGGLFWATTLIFGNIYQKLCKRSNEYILEDMDNVNF